MTKKVSFAGFFLLIAIVALLTFLARNYELDDALIYYRYFQNALDGKGLIYNVGEKFNGLTSPMFSYLSLALNYFTRSVPATQIVFSGALLAVSSILLVILLQKNGLPSYWAFGAALLLVSNRFIYMAFGLETMLFFVFMLITLILFFKHDYFMMGIFAAAMFLTRGESLFLITTLIIFHFLMKRKFPSPTIFIIPVLMLLGNYLFNYYYYGAFLPNTVSAKMHHGDSGLWRSFPFLRFKQILFHDTARFFPKPGQEILFVFFVLTGLYGAWANFRESTLIRILLLFSVKYTLFYVILNIPSYNWYYALYFLVGSVFVMFGLRSLYLKIRDKKLSAAISIGIFLVFFGAFLFTSLKMLPADKGNAAYKEIGLWLKHNTPANAKIACVEIGHIGWYSDRYIIDILGLVNPHNAELIGKKDFDGFFEYYTPDFIFVHDPIWNHEAGVKSVIMSGEYIESDNFDFPGYKLLEKNEKFRADR